MEFERSLEHYIKETTTTPKTLGTQPQVVDHNITTNVLSHLDDKEIVNMSIESKENTNFSEMTAEKVHEVYEKV